MTTGSAILAGLLVLLAIAHSTAGETGFIRPLIAAEWDIVEAPRWAANRLLRLAWHLTSVAWIALAVTAAGGSAVAAASVTALVSGALMFVWLRAHPAWPVFLTAGAAGLWADDLLTSPVLATVAGLTVAALFALAGLHLYWALGGRWLLDAAVPTTSDGESTFDPGAIASLAVALALTVFGAILIATMTIDDATVPRWLTLAGTAVLAARAIGDTRYAGFTKTNRDTVFADYDDRFFTPLVVLLAMGSVAAVLA